MEALSTGSFPFTMKVQLVNLLAVFLLLTTSTNVASGQSERGGCGRWCGPSDSGIQCQDDLLCEQGEDGIYRCGGCDCEDDGGEGSPGNIALEDLSDCGQSCSWYPCKPGLSCTEGGLGEYVCTGGSCGEDGDCGSDCRLFPCKSGLSCNNEGNGYFCSGSSCGDGSGLRGCHSWCGASTQFGAQCESGLTCTSLASPFGSTERCLGSSCAVCDGLCGPSANGAQCTQKESCIQGDDGAYRCSKTPIGLSAGGDYGGGGQWCGLSDSGLLCQRSLSCDEGDDGIFRCSGSWCGSDGGGKLGGCDDSCGPSDNGSQCQAGLQCEGNNYGRGYVCRGSSCPPQAADGQAGCRAWCGSSTDNNLQCISFFSCNRGRDGIYRCGEKCDDGSLNCVSQDLGARIGDDCGPDGIQCQLVFQCAKDVDGVYRCAQ